MGLVSRIFTSLTLLVLVVRSTGWCVDPPDSQALLKGKSLYENKCAKCHRLYDPKDYDQEKWAHWKKKMKKKARLNTDEYTLIFNYTERLREA